MAATFVLLSLGVMSSGNLLGVGAPHTGALSSIGLLSEGDIALVKASGSRQSPDVGIFGNSRSVHLTARDVGMPDGRFFNYSVPGGSFRQSVSLMEVLSTRSSLPKTVVISIDHFEMAFMSRAQFPSGWRRWRQAARDISQVAQTSGPKLAAQSMVDHIRGEWGAFSSSWNVAKTWGRSKFIWSALVDEDSATNSRWNHDGSRTLDVPVRPDMTFAPKTPFILHEPYLVRDLGRVARLVHQSGVRVIIYESPIDPANDAIYRSDSSPAAKRLRTLFLDRCGRLDLECYPTPKLGESEDVTGWPDCCHAPTTVLGRFVGSLI